MVYLCAGDHVIASSSRESQDVLRTKGIEITRGPSDLTFVNGTISVFFIEGPNGATVEIVQRAANMR